MPGSTNSFHLGQMPADLQVTLVVVGGGNFYTWSIKMPMCGFCLPRSPDQVTEHIVVLVVVIHGATFQFRKPSCFEISL